MRDVVLYVMVILNIVSMVGMVAGILMHSGRGGGLSDMFGGGGGAALGSSAAERNLTRITTVLRADLDLLRGRARLPVGPYLSAAVASMPHHVGVAK